MKKHFIPVLLLAATLVMAGCNEREIATSSTSKTGLSTSDPTSLSTSGAESVESLTSASVESKDSQPVNPVSEVSNSSNPTSADTASQDSASSQSTQEVVPVYVDWYVVGQGAFLNGGPSWGDGGVRMQEMEEALGVAHVTFSVGDKFKVSDKAASNAKWLGHDVLDKGTAYVNPDGDGNMVLNQAGTYDVVLTNEEHIKLLATGNTPVKEDPVPETLTHDYYVIGNMADSNWGANKEKYGMDKITSDDKADYYRSDALELAAGVELKVVDQEKHNDKWFPTNNIAIADAGTYYVYYLPSHDGVGDVWHDGCVAVTLATAEAPAIPSKTVEPPVPTCAYQMYVDNGEDWAFHTLSVDPEDASKFTVTVELTAGLAVGFMDSEWNTLGYYNVDYTSQSIIECTDDNSDNILILHDGTYTFKLDNSYTGACISISAEFPATYSIIINDQAANLETGPLEGDEANNNNDVYKNVRLEETDIVEIKLGNDYLHFYHYDKEAQVNVDDGTEYLAEYDGVYTFWLAKDGKVWVDVLRDVKQTAQYDVDLGEWANAEAVVFAHSWKEGYANYTAKVENGKITVIAECDGFMLVRMPAESTAIDWDTLWNKTGDLTVGEGTLTFKAWGGEDKISTFEWVEPQQEEPSYSIIVNNEVENFETGPLSENEAENNADVYKNVRLKETDIVEIKLGNDYLHFYHHGETEDVDDGTEYMAEADGLYTFWLAKDGKVWVDVLRDVKQTAQYDVDLGEWANAEAVVFAHSWKEGYATLTSKVENGKMTLIAECDGFMLVRMPSESTDINWDALWNKTGDLIVGEGTLTFKAWGGEDKISTFEWVKEEQHSVTTQTVTLSYTTNTTTNMNGENQAALLGADASKLSVVGTKVSNNNVGLNKDGTMRLYAAGACTLTIKGLDVKIVSISVNVKQAPEGLLVQVDGQTITAQDGVYNVNAAVGTEIVLSNSLSSGQVHINSITVTYEA